MLPTPTFTFIPINTATTPTGRRISRPPAPEIIEQTEGRVTHFVTLLGTSGTFIGTSRRLKQDIPGVQCISAQPSTGFHGIEGTKHMATAIVPRIYDPTLADRNILNRDGRRL